VASPAGRRSGRLGVKEQAMNETAVERAKRIIQGRAGGSAAVARRPAVPPAGAEPCTKKPGSAAPALMADGENFIGTLNIMFSRLRQFDDWLRAQHELNLTELHVLDSLPDALPTVPNAQGGSTAARLAAEVELSPSGLTRLVDRLVDRGLVARVPDGWDKRVRHLVLTPQGRAVRDAVVPRVAQQVHGTCGGHRALLERLRRIAEHPAG
jgi:DNA-binding MarR family transcriptional regulator